MKTLADIKARAIPGAVLEVTRFEFNGQTTPYKWLAVPRTVVRAGATFVQFAPVTVDGETALSYLYWPHEWMFTRIDAHGFEYSGEGLTVAYKFL